MDTNWILVTRCSYDVPKQSFAQIDEADTQHNNSPVLGIWHVPGIRVVTDMMIIQASIIRCANRDSKQPAV